MLYYGEWRSWRFRFEDDGVLFYATVNRMDTYVIKNSIQDFPDGLRSLILLCLSLPLGSLAVPYMYKDIGVKLWHFIDSDLTYDEGETWQLAFDRPQELTELLKP